MKVIARKNEIHSLLNDISIAYPVLKQ